ncbi:MAG: DnaD domain protein [Bacilli bacterium]|nr:DnaD domain protein [Bacilli bacterium]
MKDNLLPADTYTIINQSILTEIDKKILISLYEPIIGATAVSLYLTFWSDLDKLEIMSLDYNHHHLMTILKSDLKTIEKARKTLEAVGLLKSFIKKNDNINEYLYELYSPISAYEFFNHPVLSVLLLNNIGEIEYNNLLNYYKKHVVSKHNYEEITSSMNEIFTSVTTFEATNDSIRKQNKLGINLENLIDFDLIIAGLPKGMINPKTFNKKNRELINQLAFVYNIDSIRMIDILRLVIDDVGMINKDKLRETARKNYEYNHNGSLPTLIYRTQPEHLKTPDGDLSNRGKMIYVFENTKPFDFLTHKNKGVKPTSRDLKLIEHLAVDFALPPGVVNVLIDYAIRVNDGKLNQNYLATIASSWARKGIKTVPEAMEIAEKGHRKVQKSIDANKKQQAKIPSWMNKTEEITTEEMTEEELAELENLYKEFR